MITTHEGDTNFDYEFAAEQRKNPQKGLVQLMGEKALKWAKGINAKRKAEKAERKYNGSLDEISHDIVPFHEAYTYVGDNLAENIPKPHKMTAPGMYRSIHAIHNPAEPGEGGRDNEGVHALDDGMAELMRGAVHRARERMAGSNAPTTEMKTIRPHDETQEIKASQDNDELVGAGK